MAYNANLPANAEYIADAPAEIRENFRALKEDAIVNAGKVNGLNTGNASGNIPVSNGTVCTNLNADKLDGNDASAFATSGHAHSAATTSSNGFMSNTDKTKLDGIASGAQVNQNAFSNILVGSTTVAADTASDTVEFVAGANIALTGDATNDRVTIGVNGTVASAAACTGNAATATKLATARTINGVSFDGSANITVADSTKAPIAHSSSATTYGISTASIYGHAMASSATPLVAGTAAVGTDNGKFAREGHVHPAQTTITGNAGTATKLAAARTISLNGDVTGSAIFDGSANIYISTTFSGSSSGKQLFTARGTATACNATGSAGATLLSLTSVTPITGTFLAGQVININGVQYMIQANITAASGTATVTISPPLANTVSNVTVDMNTSFTVPTGVTKVWVSMAGGGGGGASVMAQAVTVSPNESIIITVGSGGSGGTSTGSTGSPGFVLVEW